MRKLNLIAALLLSAGVAGCAMGPDYERPGFSFPSQWPWESSKNDKKEQQPKKLDVVSQQWWQEFDDPALTALVEEGLQGNTDLTVAASRVSQARGILTTNRADLYPTIDVQGGAVRQRNSGEAKFGGFTPSTKPFNDFSLAAVLNYEIDLWGRLRRANESARAQLMAAESNQEAVRLAVTSDIAQSYFNLRALDAQLEITQNTIKSRQESLTFQQTQYRLGGENALTFRQAEAELALAQAQLPILEQAHQEQETSLAVLLGRSPQDIVEGKIKTGRALDNLPAAPLLPTDLPSSLMERRPDISASEELLVSANADIGAAKADYFPRLSLAGLIGLDSSETNRLLRGSARNWQGGATFTGPLLDLGRKRGAVETAEGSKEEAVANYQQTVRVAFKEVVDALSAERTAQKREQAQLSQSTARAETVRLSQLRYKAGYSNYLEVLDAQRQLFSAQLDRVTARRDRLVAAVNLYKALGGGWSVPSGKKK